MRTAVCDLPGIEQPIVQAPIAQVPRLAAAVSSAGALGTVALTWAGGVAPAPRDSASPAPPLGAPAGVSPNHGDSTTGFSSRLF